MRVKIVALRIKFVVLLKKKSMGSYKRHVNDDNKHSSDSLTRERT
jgi:hypothetical protein